MKISLKENDNPMNIFNAVIWQINPMILPLISKW